MQERRSSAYGLALATFGLSYCLGPIAGGFISEHLGGPSVVFVGSVLMAGSAVAYILTLLPESRPGSRWGALEGRKEAADPP